MVTDEDLDEHFVMGIGVLAEHSEAGFVERRPDAAVTVTGPGGAEFNVGWITGEPDPAAGTVTWLRERLLAVTPRHGIVVRGPISEPVADALDAAGYEAARRRGFGAAMTWAAVAAGAERGATVAALHATALGEPVYRRMGFVTRSTVHRFVPRT